MTCLGRPESTAGRIAVVGPGAIGLFFGSLLSHRGLDVWFLDRSKERAAYLTKHGLLLEQAGEVKHLPIKVTSDAAEIGACDLVIICVKSHDTTSAASALPPLLHQKSLILTLQNGLGNVEVLNRLLPKRQIVIGVTSQGITLVKTGHIRHAGGGATYLGSLVKDEEVKRQLASIAKILTAAGLPVEVVTDIKKIVWNKLLINVAINALSAITRLENGGLVSYPEIQNLMAMAVTEATEVARHKGIAVTVNALEEAISACRATAKNRSSMLQDVLSEKQTEIEAINGAIVKEARAQGIEAPVNNVLTLLVRAIEKSYHSRIV